MKFLILLILPFTLLATESETMSNKHSTIEHMKLACTNPGAVNRQIPPSYIKILCKEKRKIWKEADGQAGFFEMPGTGYGKAYIMNSKHDHIKMHWPLNIEPMQFSCYSIFEYWEKRVLETSMDCDAFLAIADDIPMYCAGILDEVPVMEVPTGNELSTCPNLSGKTPVQI